MRIWQRRKVKASDERKPASRVSRSASLKGRTKIGRFILQRINLDYHLVWRCTRYVAVASYTENEARCIPKCVMFVLNVINLGYIRSVLTAVQVNFRSTKAGRRIYARRLFPEANFGECPLCEFHE